jgi:hypothetical protein
MKCPSSRNTLGETAQKWNYSHRKYLLAHNLKLFRAAIIGSYHANGGHAFWAIALRQPLQENRITGNY